jgi:hypothetical protein
MKTFLVVQGEEDKVISRVEDQLGYSSANLGPVLDPDAKLHRRKSRANTFTILGKGEAIPGVPISKGARVAVLFED